MPVAVEEHVEVVPLRGRKIPPPELVRVLQVEIGEEKHQQRHENYPV